MFTLKDKVICVTGAASGIGLATAKILFTQGAKLSLLDLREESLETAVNELLGDSTERDRIIFTAVDIRSSEQVDAWVANTVKHFGCLDGAANVAGAIGKNYGVHDISELSNEEWDFIQGTNLTGLFYCLRAQLKAIRNGGSIVNTSSVAGLEGHGKNGAYSASKHGVIGLTKSAAKEVGSKGIRVNSIAPRGVINTPMIASFGAVASGKLDVFSRVPLAREQSKIALVTGASSGMGRAISLALAKEGAKLVCCDLRELPNPEGYEADIEKPTQDLITSKGGEAIFQRVDISIPSEIETAVAKAIEEFGRLDILINCAGYWAPFREFVDEDDELWGKMVAVNTLGTAKASRLAIRQFLTQEVDEKWGSRGRIVNISSCAGHIAFAGEVAYSATKASINHMTRAGAIDHAKDSININCVAPGAVQTGMARANFENADIIKIMRNATPWPRTGFAEDIAGAVMFFCLPQSQWVTGQLLAVDGGMTLGVPAPS
ncbi:Levodione reductase [Lachnellula occidentalis]|uniref:Levodione reductase n=1 Tax=Lachnellula occidentalis TaxID=215460 RepID=A0A8H8REH4_9HELO|nr:Levodione reductase [Lachnellula occidentalis]